MSYLLHVFCDGRPLRDTLEPSHKGRRAHIARMEFLAAGESNLVPPSPDAIVSDRDMWVPHPVSRRRYRKLRSAGVEATEAMVCEYIGADGSVIDMEAAIAAGGDMTALNDSHLKVVMRCPLCHLDLQNRMETLAPYLDELRLAGWAEVSLASLAAIVAK